MTIEKTIREKEEIKGGVVPPFLAVVDHGLGPKRVAGKDQIGFSPD